MNRHTNLPPKFRLPRVTGLIHHSNRDSQYASGTDHPALTVVGLPFFNNIYL